MVQKHKHVHLQEWLEIAYWRQQGFFYTETNPQKSVKKQPPPPPPEKKQQHKKNPKKQQQKENKWPMYCQGILLLGQICFGFRFHAVTRSKNTYPNTQKACNHTRERRAAAPAVGHAAF